MSLEKLKEEYSACQRCPALCKSRSQVVFGSGNYLNITVTDYDNLPKLHFKSYNKHQLSNYHFRRNIKDLQSFVKLIGVI
ncbi:MAG: hypothetical protein AABX37_00415 [Nanoarchaeota archaeon]